MAGAIRLELSRDQCGHQRYLALKDFQNDDHLEHAVALLEQKLKACKDGFMSKDQAMEF